MACYSDVQMKDEMVRYGTFSQYKSMVPKGLWFIRLAAAGFYLSLRKTARCAFCGTEADMNMFESRDPLELHRERSPMCPLVLKEGTENRTVEQAGQVTSLKMIHSLLQIQGQSQEERPSSVNVGQASGREMYLPEGGTVMQSARPVEEIARTGSSLPAYGNAADGFSSSSWSKTNVQQGSSGGSEQNGMQARTKQDNQSGGQRPQSGNPLGSSVPTPQVSVTQNNETNPQTSRKQAGGSRQAVTYEQLGIYTQRPKRPDLAVTASRVVTFARWPLKETHSPDEMAEAGFFYTGHGDLVRCFFCKGGLKSWADDLRPWVQHAQWFPKCPFVLQAQGPEFVAAVQALKDQLEVVSPEAVRQEMMRQSPGQTQGDDNTVPGRNRKPTSPLQETTTAASRPPPAATTTASTTAGGGGAAAAAAYTREESVESNLDSQELVLQEEDLARLEEENREMTSSRFCKICLSEEATILFLPCGHLVACAQCAPALRSCAVCRQKVSGTVRISTNCD